MISYLLKIGIVIVVSAVFTNCSDAQIKSVQNPSANEPKLNAEDLSTDKAVIAELQRIVDAKSAELAKDDEKLKTKQRAANRLEPKDVCIKRLKESAKIIVIGFFRTDSGCHLDGVFVNSQYLEREKFDLSKNVLAALGWDKANQTERKNLAKIWVENGLLVFAPLPNQILSAVSISGEIKVTAMSEYPPGVTSRNVSKAFVFDKDGGLISGKDY